MSQPANKNQLFITILSIAAVAALVAIFYSPIWWVSLTAPNYPKEAFPDGIRIDFHLNGVFNGCKRMEKTEVNDEIALDCVHEMDTINHYVGMYPIAAGGVVEKAYAPFLLSMLGVMVIGFIFFDRKKRMGIFVAGFMAIIFWMYLTMYTENGLKYQSSGYLEALVLALDQDTSEETEEMTPGQAVIARLEASLRKSEGEAVKEDKGRDDKKTQSIKHLRATFEKHQERRPSDERLSWNGSGSQMLSWHYEKNLGRYFNNPAEIKPMAAKMTMAHHIFFWVIIGLMLLVLFGGWKKGGLFYWIQIIPPIALPVFFLVEYAAWLWWYGHTLNEMGAFTVKPFMPTVFGDGKVAQFTTHSYPSYGFGLMLLFSALLVAVALLRRRQLHDAGES